MGFLGDIVVAPFEKLPRYTSGRWMHYNVKECGHVPTNKSSPLGQPWGLGHDALEFRCLMWSTAQRVLLHLLGCPPSPYAINLPLDAHGVNYDSLTPLSAGYLPPPSSQIPPMRNAPMLTMLRVDVDI